MRMMIVRGKISYRNDNKRRDEKYGIPKQDEPVDTSELADKVRVVDRLSGFLDSHMLYTQAPGFRYVP